MAERTRNQLRAAFRGLCDGLDLYIRLVGAQFRAQLQYRTSFALQLVSNFCGTWVDMVTIVLLLSRFSVIDGWTVGEVLLLYGIAGVAFGLGDMAVGGFDHLSESIRTSAFDRVMTRPAGTFLQTLAGEVLLRRFVRIFQAAIALLIAFSLTDIHWTVAKVLVLLGALGSGMVITASIFVIGAAFTFWTVQTSEITNVFTYGGQEMMSYPMSIYADWLRSFFTFVVPLSFVSYLPALYILERPDPLSLPAAFQLLSPLVAALFFLVARAAWELGVRHYQSTGS